MGDGLFEEPTDLWAAVVGQEAAVERLAGAADSPVHAYLIVGPEGSGKEAIARALAADLLSIGLDDAGKERARRLVAAGSHPAMTVAEPQGAAFLKDDAIRIVGGRLQDGSRAEGVVWRKPAEGEHQVVVMPRLVPADDPAFPPLLKAVEEPPPSTKFVICATEVPTSMAAIASRCSRIDIGPIASATLVDQLVAEGIDPERAQTAADGARGSLRRARLLARDDGAAARYAAWASVPTRLDGTGARACEVADEIADAVDALLEPLAELQAEELQRLAEQYEPLGEDPPKGRVKQIEDRHKREQRRVRREELQAGLAAMVGRYRDEVVQSGNAAAFVVAAQRTQRLCDALDFNPNEALQLRALFVSLPPLSSS